MNFKVEEVFDSKKWDLFIENFGKWNLFQSFIWGDVQKKLGVKVWRLALVHNDTYYGIAQIFLVNARRGSFIHVRHGPVMSSEPFENDTYWHLLFDRIKRIARDEGVWFIRVSPMMEESNKSQIFFKKNGFQPSPIHRMDGEVCWVLDITPTEVELLANMRKTTRYLIKQAEKAEVTVSETNNIRDFLRLYEETALRHKFVEHKGVEEEFEIFKKNDACRLYTASHNGEVLASALILYFGDQAIYHHGASKQSKIPVTYALQWRAIKDAKKHKKKIYNFWGIAPEKVKNHPWQGITLFKQGFGGSEKRFVHAHDYAISPFYAISYTIELARRWKRGY